MGCWYSKCRGPKKAAAKKEAKEAVEIKAVNTLPSGGEDAAGADDAEDLSNRTSITNENAILPNDDASAPSPTKPKRIHIVVNTPAASAAIRARQDESEAAADDDDAEEDEVGPLPSPRPRRPTLKRMATSEISDHFCEGEDDDVDGNDDDDDEDSSSHVSVEAIRRAVGDEARTQACTDSMIAESGSRVASSVGFLEQSVEEPADSETQGDEGGEGDEVKRIEVYPCSSVEDQGDDDGEVDETRLTVPEEVLPASPQSSSDEERSLGGDEEMEPIKEEPEEEEKEELELEDSRLRDEQNNNDHGHDNCTDKFASSGTSTEDIANMDTESGKSNLTRRRSLADSVHDLQHELEKELELRLGPDIDIGETPPENTTASDSARGKDRLKNGAPVAAATVELSVSEGQEVKRTSCHVQIGGGE